MKKILLTLVLLVGIIFGLFAQNLTYQAVVRDNNQQLVVNTAVKATVTIEFTSGDPYQAEVNGSTNIHGLLSIEFGDETLKGRDWTGATIDVKVVKASDENVVYVNDDARPVSAVPYALSVDGQSVQNYLTEHQYVDLAKLNDTLNAYPTTADMNGRNYLRSDSAVITTMQSDIAELKTGQFDCNKVKDCIKDTLGKYTPTTDLCNVLNDCQFSGQTIAELLQGLTNQISDLKEQVDSLSNLSHGGGDTPTAFTCGTDKVKDVDNNEYNTVQIGSQCWMAQNLRTKVEGSEYPKNGDNYVTGEDTVIYGRLYTWTAVTKGASTNYPAVSTDTIVHGICPTGWHVPSDAEFDTLTKYVKGKMEYRCEGADNDIAKALASKTGWATNETNCNVGNNPENNNATGFSAVPAGNCFFGSFFSFGTNANFWSATQREDQTFTAWYRYLRSIDSYVSKGSIDKDNGYSVRCLRDAGIGGTLGENETGGTTPSTPATMSCDDVMNCLGDTLGKLNDKIVAQGAEIATLKGTVTEQGNTITTQGQTIENLSNTVTEQNQTITEQGNTIDSLAHIVDSLSNLPHGGGDTPTTFTCGTDKVKDVDNNEYNTVQIGNQCWTKENLRTTAGLTENTNYWHADGQSANDGTYGLLYNWAAMMNRATSTNYPASGSKVQGICPAGWHVPSDAEWDTLTYYVFNSTSPNYKCGSSCGSWAAKSNVSCIANALSDTTGWNSNASSGCNAGNTGEKSNLTGFSAVPAGHCVTGSFTNFGNRASFWSATQSDVDVAAGYRYLASDYSSVNSTSANKAFGFSVRCLRD